MNYQLKTVFTGSQIDARIKELGEQISSAYTDGKQILCICVLRGAFMFFSELVKHLKGDIIVDFITLSSYGGTQTTGDVKLVGDIRESVEDRHLLIVEDIIDSGYTVEFLRRHFLDSGALSVEIACLLDKPSGRKVQIEPDYKAFTLENSAFIVGYGLDYDQRHRNYGDIKEVCFDR